LDSLFTIETQIRLIAFLALLLIMATGERLWPRRSHRAPLKLRWLSNLGIGTLNILVLRFGFPLLGVGLAGLADARGWGLLNMINPPAWLGFIASLLLLDLLIWFQHRLFHHQPLLWRLHRMHHADQDFDASTGVRFHPLEAILSMLIKSAAILTFGVSPLAYLTFEIILSSTSLFNHSNIRIPRRIDRWLRLLVVTPDMHRVHHSIVHAEMNRNFGFNLPWWDRLFGSYKDQPDAGHEAMEIGTLEFRTETDLRLDRMLLQPFVGVKKG